MLLSNSFKFFSGPSLRTGRAYFALVGSDPIHTRRLILQDSRLRRGSRESSDTHTHTPAAQDHITGQATFRSNLVCCVVYQEGNPEKLVSTSLPRSECGFQIALLISLSYLGINYINHTINPGRTS